MTKPFNIYRSSAGSGKTRTLAKEYLTLALRYPEYFRCILAMTFTNKSTQEMKDRIIRYLDDFSKGKSEDLVQEILDEYKKQGFVFSTDQLKRRSSEVLSLILHQYGQFSVSTIDAFFQRVIRSFTRETGLLGNFRLEVDHDLVLDEVISLLMDELTDNKELRGWVMDFSLERLEGGENWDIRSALKDFSKEIFREEFKVIEKDVLTVTSEPAFFSSFKKSLQHEVNEVEQYIKANATKLLNEFHHHNLTASDFYYGTRGSIYVYVTNLAEGKIATPNSYVLAGLESTEKWAGTKADKKLIQSMAEQSWHAQLSTLVQYIEKKSEAYYSAVQALQHLYAFGLLADISKTLKNYLSSNNMMLLSNAPAFLNTLMDEQDTSFVLEKVGSFYRHYLVDEFQDTSGIQWKNILPLIRNGIAQQYKSLIVGDIKQSIYRWRGGDLTILQEKAKENVGELMTDTFPLDTNYRSAENIVTFNNALFEASSKIISAETGTAFPHRAYEDVAQKSFKHLGKGYVQIEFIEDAPIPAEQENEKEVKVGFDDAALARLPKLLEDIQERKIQLGDIAFLVRDNREGQKIAQHFMAYRSSSAAKPDMKYDVVSNESLRLDQASSVLILINAMRLMENQKNAIARAHLAFEYQKLWQPSAFPNDHQLFMKCGTKQFETLIPAAFTKQYLLLEALPLVELVENLIYIFRLGEHAVEIAYLQAFQDIVLDFSVREQSNLQSFLIWWEENKHKKSVQVAGGIDAAQIITIHKSKGLQFKYVIIPFLNWELNHPPTKSPILWCKSEEPLFKDAGYIPLKYSSKLENTFFKNEYIEERQRIYLDNLNLVYVAFTRAEEGLIAYAPLTKSDKVSHVGQLVKRAIETNETLQTNWNAQEQRWKIGEQEVLSNEQKKTEPSLTLRKYPVTLWRDRLQVSKRGTVFFDPTGQQKKINEGIFLHELLALIIVREDASAVIDRAVLEGLIREDEKESITNMITWIVHHPSLTSLFDEGVTIKTEASLLLPDGSERRIDRLAIQNNEAHLVDYKTGEPAGRDEEQVMEYLSILHQMGYKKVSGFLVYAKDKKCHAVEYRY